MQPGLKYPATDVARGLKGSGIVHRWAWVSRALAVLLLFGALALVSSWHRPTGDERAWTVLAAPAQARIETPEQAYQLFQEGLFERLPGVGVGRGLLVSDLWVAVTLPARHDLGRQAFLTIAPAHLDQVDLFSVEDGGALTYSATSGYRIQPSLRPMGQRQAVFPLTLKPRSHYVWLVRVHARTASAVLIDLQSLSAHQEGEFQEGVLIGSATLLTLLILAISMLLRTWSVEESSWSLTWVILGGAVFLAGWHGLLTLWMNWSAPLWSDIQDAGVCTFGLWAMYRWAADVRRMRTDFPWLSWLMRLAVASTVPMALFAMSRGWSPLVGGVAAYFLLLGLMGTGVLKQLVMRVESSSHSALGWLICASVAFHLWAEAGGMLLTPATVYGWQVMLVAGCLAMLLDLLARGMVDRMHARSDRLRLHAMLLNEKSQLEMRVDDRARALQTANEELRLTESSQRELLSMASHEFRTPAAMIKGTLDALELVSDALPADMRSRVGQLRVASNRLIFLANKLIAHDRWRELSVQPQRKPLWVRAWVLQVMGEYDDDVPVRLSLPTQDIQMSGDAVLLRIALQTLIDNALVHSAQNGGTVRVALGVDDIHLALTVTDCGPGIPDEQKPHVFDRFFSTSAHNAQGLGLSIVAAVARMHGGEARVSDVLPHGARFHIVLPHLGVTRSVDDEGDDDAP